MSSLVALTTFLVGPSALAAGGPTAATLSSADRAAVTSLFVANKIATGVMRTSDHVHLARERTFSVNGVTYSRDLFEPSGKARPAFQIAMQDQNVWGFFVKRHDHWSLVATVHLGWPGCVGPTMAPTSVVQAFNTSQALICRQFLKSQG
jgi:hypothetical protein